MPAEFRRAHRAPRNAVTRPVEAAEGACKAAHIRQHVLFGYEHVLQRDFAGDRGAKRELAFDLGRFEALETPFHDEAADDPIFIIGVVGLCPYDGEVRNRRIGDPHLSAVQHIAAIDLLRARLHRAGVRAVVGLREPEAADPFAGCELGEVFLALRVRAIGVDRVHDEGGLHAHGGAVAAVHSLDLAGGQAIADIGETGASIFLGQGKPQHPLRAHLVHDLAMEDFVAVRLFHARKQLFLAISAGAIAHHALFLGKLLLKKKRVLPVEGCERRIGLFAGLCGIGFGGLRHGVSSKRRGRLVCE